MDALAVILRVLHIAAAVIAGGAAFFQLVALRPALQQIDDAPRAQLRAAILRRWWVVVVTLIAVLLVTGLLNYLLYRVPMYRNHPDKGIYHAIFGIKFLLALAVFHAATVLASPGPKFDKYRAKAGFWLKYLVVLFTLIIVLGAVLNNFTRLWPGPV